MLLYVYESPKEVSTYCCAEDIPAATVHSADQHQSWRERIDEVIVGGDGRCDSPGHSAKYGTYSLMDAEQNKILDSQLVQVCTKLN